MSGLASGSLGRQGWAAQVVRLWWQRPGLLGFLTARSCQVRMLLGGNLEELKGVGEADHTNFGCTLALRTNSSSDTKHVVTIVKVRERAKEDRGEKARDPARGHNRAHCWLWLWPSDL